MHSINTSFSAMVPIGLLLLLGLWTAGSSGQDSCACKVVTNCVDPCPYTTSFLDCLQQFCDVCGGESQVTSTCQDTLNWLENKCGTDCGLSWLRLYRLPLMTRFYVEGSTRAAGAVGHVMRERQVEERLPVVMVGPAADRLGRRRRPRGRG